MKEHDAAELFSKFIIFSALNTTHLRNELHTINHM